MKPRVAAAFSAACTAACVAVCAIAAPSPYAQLKFTPYELIDHQLGNLPVGMFAVPAGWHAQGTVQWRWQDVSFPVRAAARIEADDHSAWVESYPNELFFWLAPQPAQVAVGATSLGMTHAPNVTLQEAMRAVITRARGNMQSLQFIGYRQVTNLPGVLHKANVPGEALGVRVRYTVNQKPVDEEFYALLSPVQQIPYTGPQGTTYEMHRTLMYVHSLGGVAGQLDRQHPLLGFVASSFKPNAAWQQRAGEVYRLMSQQFNAYLAQGYAQIQAAGALSRAISANNDAMIRAMDTTRASDAAATARQRAATAAAAGADRTDGFDQALRGTERMEDPYWGTSEQSSQFSYHWTDGYGNYQHSNDSTFDANAGSSQNWQRMEPAR